MDRRKLLLGLGFTGIASTARAEYSCSQYDWNGVQQCTAGVPSLRFKAGLQIGQNWCWAACIQMIFATARRRVSQRAIVHRLFGEYVDRPANDRQILATVNGRWQETNGNYFSAYAEPILAMSLGVWSSDAAAQAAQELANGYPLINGAVGHATVLTAMTYLTDVYGRGMPLELIVRDPSPNQNSRRKLNANEYYNTRFLAKIRVG